MTDDVCGLTDCQSERHRELDCFFRLNDYLAQNPNMALEPLLQGYVELIPHGFLEYSGVFVELKVLGKSFIKSSKCDMEFTNCVNVQVGDKDYGTLFVGLGCSNALTGGFEASKNKLLMAIARQIGSILKKHESQVPEHENQYARMDKLVTYADLAYFRISKEGIYQKVSKKFAMMHGYKSDNDLIGNHYSLLQTHKDKYKFEYVIRSLLYGKGLMKGESTHLKRNGKIGKHSFSMVSVKVGDEVRCIEGILTEIEELPAILENHENQVQPETDDELTRQLQVIFSTIPDYIGVLNPDHSVVKYNQAVYDMLKMAEEDVVGNKCYELLGQTERCDDCPVSQVIKTKTFSTKTIYNEKLKKWLDIRAYPIMDDYGNVKQVVEHFRDITNDMNARDRLEKSEHKYRLAMMAATDGMFDWDLHTRDVSYSPRWFTMLGYDPDELEHHYDTWRALVHPDDLNKVEKIIWGAIDNIEPFEFEVRMQCKNGEWSWILSRGQCVEFDAHGKPKRIMGTHTDITLRKKLQGQVSQSDKMRAIGELAGGIAHDFNNQLTGIIGYAGLLMEALEDESHKKFAESIFTGAHRAAELTKQLLGFSRKNQTMDIPVDIHKLLQEVESILLRSIDKNINLTTRLKADTFVVHGDATLLQNAFLNLAINARDAMPEGGELIISTRVIEIDDAIAKTLVEELKPGYYIRVCVSDTGTGIPEHIRDRIFEPFFTTKEEGKGTGMGLPAVYGTINNHGGCVNLYSEDNHGTTFTIYLPLAAETAIVTAEEDVIEKVSKDEKKYTILTVDDESIILDLLGEMLKAANHTVLACNNGLEAVQIYEKHWQEIDLVIMDMIMPRMGGDQAARKMQRVKPDVKVLLCSGHEFKDEAEQQGSNSFGFLQKPYEKKALLDKVNSILNDE
jgi:PAS domain S-box-containing protein